MTAQAPTTPLDELREVVSRHCGELQREYLAKNSAAAAALAKLRRAVTAEPGADADVWEHTLALLSDRLLGGGDAPSGYERATHTAMTLFAVHQQSKDRRMHDPTSDRSLGGAVAVLQRHQEQTTGSGASVRRRFSALATAEAYAELTHHLRGLVGQLRSADVALHYGWLAVDLAELQRPGGALRVRLRWGRDLYRRGPQSIGSEQPTLTPTLDLENS